MEAFYVNIMPYGRGVLLKSLNLTAFKGGVKEKQSVRVGYVKLFFME